MYSIFSGAMHTVHATPILPYLNLAYDMIYLNCLAVYEIESRVYYVKHPFKSHFNIKAHEISYGHKLFLCTAMFSTEFRNYLTTETSFIDKSV